MQSKLEIDFTNSKNSKTHIMKVIEREETKVQEFKKQIQDIMLVYYIFLNKYIYGTYHLYKNFAIIIIGSYGIFLKNGCIVS